MKHTLFIFICLLVHLFATCAEFSEEEEKMRQALDMSESAFLELLKWQRAPVQPHTPSPPEQTPTKPEEDPIENTAPSLTREQLTKRAQDYLKSFNKR